MSSRGTRTFALAGALLFFAPIAHAEPAMFQAQFHIEAFGDQFPVAGAATGSEIFSASTSLPYSGFGYALSISQSALGVTTGAPWRISPTTFSTTYATFVNDAGSFFTGGGPAAGLGMVSYVGGGTPGGSWVILEGKNPRGLDAFGGAMGLLGRLGAVAQFGVDGGKGHPTLFNGSSSWNLIRAMGRSTADSMNPYTNTGMFTSSGMQARVTTYTKFAVGTRWTTGTARVYVNTGWFTTSISAQGYDVLVVPGSFGTLQRNIQLVTPSLTHWRRGSESNDSGHIGIFKLRFAPEPSAALLFAAGAGVLVLLRRVSRRG